MKPCSMFQPEVVRCTNEGGEGTDIDWKCEADLPESLRFGRVEVSCEGWSGSGDPYILKGSCGLQYRLVRVPNFSEGENNLPSSFSRWFKSADIGGILFMSLWVSALIFMLYKLLSSCLRGGSDLARLSPPQRRPPPSGPPGSFFDPPNDDAADYPPPPYTDTSKNSPRNQDGFRPGFWSGLGLGGLGATAATHYLRNRDRPTRSPAETRAYDWERDRVRPSRLPPSFSSNDRGEGPSSLGSMRRSTGLGGSNVR